MQPANGTQRQVVTPTTCPFCPSTDVKTNSKVVNESTYWRCVRCGEIWNPSRLQPPPSPRYGGRW